MQDKQELSTQQLIEEELPRLRVEIAGAVARGYCYVENSKKVLDPDLLKAMGKELEMLFKKELSTIATKSAEKELNECKMIVLGVIVSLAHAGALGTDQIVMLNKTMSEALSKPKE